MGEEKARGGSKMICKGREKNVIIGENKMIFEAWPSLGSDSSFRLKLWSESGLARIYICIRKCSEKSEKSERGTFLEELL